MTGLRRLIAIGLAMSLASATALADVVAVVSARNPVTVLSKSQVMDIFLGRKSHYPDGRQAVPIDQTEGSAARNEFYINFTGKSAAQIKAHWSKMVFTGKGLPPREASNSVEVKKWVAENTNAIGYVEQNMVDDNVRVLLTK